MTNNHDPPLTKLGVAQAHVCGKRLRNTLENKAYDRIVIETSPFLRCLETAAAIAKELDISKIRVNYRYSEWLKEKFFPNGSPVKDLEINKIDERELSDKWLQGISIKHNKDFIDKLADLWPERYNDCASRAKDFGADLHYKYRDTDEKTAHLVVTHGINVKAYADMAFGGDSIDYDYNGGVYIPQIVNYTGIALSSIRGSSIKLIIGGTAGHLDNKAAERYLEPK